jgi:hypothetical protein
MDKRLMAEITRLKALLEQYHQRSYEPAGDVLFRRSITTRGIPGRRTRIQTLWP